MISIPIWLFVMLITLSIFFILGLILAIIGYIQCCIVENHDKNIHPDR